MTKCPACQGNGKVPDIALTKDGFIRIIDTDPDVGNHTMLCSCQECLKLKKIMFKDTTKELREIIKTGNLLLYKVLVSDGIFKA